MKRAAPILDVTIACGLALTAVLAVSTGFTLQLGGVRLPFHDWVRPLVVTLGLAGIRAWLWMRQPSTAGGSRDGGAWRVAEVTLLAVALSSLGYWLVFLTAICGGSDSYGYVAASELIRRGQLIEPQPIAAWIPVANPLDLATPAGFVPAADRSGIAPSYPLGLSALMAVAQLAVGSIGPFLVPPICGAVLLLIVWRLAASWYGHRAAWLATAIVAWEPLLVTYSKQPMSDVPATMFALLSVWGLVTTRRRPLLAGLAAGASFVIRPGGIGLLAVLVFLAAWPRESRPRDAIRFIAGLAPFVLFQALLQWRLFGSPFTSGYGPVSQLFAGGTISSNLRIYLEALWRIHSLVWFAGLLAACVLYLRSIGWGRPNDTRPSAGGGGLRQPVVLAGLAFVASAVPYILYFEFNHWETLRFLLPSLVLLSIAAAGGLARMAERLRGSWIAALTTVIAATVPAVQTERFLRSEGVPQLALAESRYPLVASHLKERTPANAIVLAAQHSGSIRHYGNRLTLRWDLLRPDDLEPLVAALTERGHAIYVVLEGTEQRRFTEGFAVPLNRLHMYPFGQIRNIQIWELVR